MVSYFPVSYNFIKNETLPIEGEKTETPHTHKVQKSLLHAAKCQPQPTYLLPSSSSPPPPPPPPHTAASSSSPATTADDVVHATCQVHARTHDSKRESGKKHHGISPRICPNPKSS